VVSHQPGRSAETDETGLLSERSKGGMLVSGLDSILASTNYMVR
jgi:hypothetical protein